MLCQMNQNLRLIVIQENHHHRRHSPCLGTQRGIRIDDPASGVVPGSLSRAQDHLACRECRAAVGPKATFSEGGFEQLAVGDFDCSACNIRGVGNICPLGPR